MRLDSPRLSAPIRCDSAPLLHYLLQSLPVGCFRAMVALRRSGVQVAPNDVSLTAAVPTVPAGPSRVKEQARGSCRSLGGRGWLGSGYRIKGWLLYASLDDDLG